MEWAYELINGYKAGDARATRIVQNSRNIVVPIVNPDGFNGSRSAGEAGGRRRRPHDDDETAYIAGAPGRVPAQELPPRRRPRGRQLHAPRSGLAENGVDPNRNYGGFWGGPGADSNPLDADLPRPRPVLRARVAQHPASSSPATR